MQLELGNIDDAEFARLETGIVERMREIRQRQLERGSAGAGKGAEIELLESGDWHAEREP